MKKILLFLPLIIIALIFAGCNAGDGSDPTKLSVSNSGRITVMDKTSYDWGDINIEGGDVIREFKLKNVGEDDLIIKTASTTCMCTTAQVITAQDTVSPLFGMHNSIAWGYSVKPDEEFTVKVTFNPMAHGPDAVGDIQRSVFLVTSSNPNSEFTEKSKKGDEMITELRVSGDVLYKADYENKDNNNSEIKPDNKKNVSYNNISAEDLKTMLKNKDFFLLDVHIPEQEHIENTDAFIPYNEIDKNISKLPSDKSKEIIVYCRSGGMSKEASQKLIDLGYTNVNNLKGGRNAFINLK